MKLGSWLARKRGFGRRFTRYGQIISKLGAFGFDDVLSKLGIGRSRASKDGRVGEMPFESRVRMLLEDLGPTFVKLGQILSMRGDILPASLTNELARLQTEVAPFPFEQAKQTVEKELGGSLEELYQSFEPEPFAAASISQVHRAVTTSGQKVAVKIRRPGIVPQVRSDLEILTNLATLAEKHLEGVRMYRPLELVEEFRKSITRELNFEREARSIRQFRSRFKDDESVHIIEVFEELSTDSVLTMELLEGVPLSRPEKLEPAGFDRSLLAQRGAEYVLKQVFQYGLFNADPHPGNFFAMGDNVIAPIDFGMVGYLGREMKRALFAVLRSFIRRDADRMVRVFLDMGFLRSSTDLMKLRHDLNGVISGYDQATVSEVSLEEVFLELTAIMRSHNLALPSELALTLKVLLTADGVGRKLDPEFDLLEAAKPFVRNYLTARFEPEQLAADTVDLVDDVTHILRRLPSDAGIVLRKLRSDSLTFRLQHENIARPTEVMERSLNRLSFAIVTAGLLVGSSLLSAAELGPKIFGIPIIGLLGYFVSALLGLGLLISMLRSRSL